MVRLAKTYEFQIKIKVGKESGHKVLTFTELKTKESAKVCLFETS